MNVNDIMVHLERMRKKLAHPAPYGVDTWLVFNSATLNDLQSSRAHLYDPEGPGIQPMLHTIAGLRYWLTTYVFFGDVKIALKRGQILAVHPDRMPDLIGEEWERETNEQ